jgi:hypothetical protein
MITRRELVTGGLAALVAFAVGVKSASAKGVDTSSKRQEKIEYVASPKRTLEKIEAAVLADPRTKDGFYETAVGKEPIKILKVGGMTYNVGSTFISFEAATAAGTSYHVDHGKDGKLDALVRTDAMVDKQEVYLAAMGGLEQAQFVFDSYKFVSSVDKSAPVRGFQVAIIERGKVVMYDFGASKKIAPQAAASLQVHYENTLNSFENALGL